MEKAKRILPALVIVLAILGLTTAPALAKEDKKTGSKKPKNYASTVAQSKAHISHLGQAPKMGHLDSKPGPAWKTVGGTLKNIHGDVYTVEDYEGNQVQLQVGQGTKQIRGSKKVGDTIRAEITRDGFANSIQ